MSFLTSRTLATGITSTDLIHVVIPTDTSQNPAGSSYKATIQQVVDFFDGNYVHVSGDTMTGNLILPTITANTIVLSGNPTTTTSFDALVRNPSTGVIEKKDLTYYNFGLFVQTGDSVNVTNTTTETSIIDGGIGNLSIPPNGFKIGDSFHVKIGGLVSANNGSIITFRCKSNSVILGSDVITFPNGVSSKSWEFRADFTIRQIGTAGVASIVSDGIFSFNTTSDILGAGFNFINNRTFDTTISNTLDFTVEWGNASVGNTIQSNICILNKLF